MLSQSSFAFIQYFEKKYFHVTIVLQVINTKDSFSYFKKMRPIIDYRGIPNLVVISTTVQLSSNVLHLYDYE